jgi:hypothetical protein
LLHPAETECAVAYPVKEMKAAVATPSSHAFLILGWTTTTLASRPRAVARFIQWTPSCEQWTTPHVLLVRQIKAYNAIALGKTRGETFWERDLFF